jgi:hypothetical protein
MYVCVYVRFDKGKGEVWSEKNSKYCVDIHEGVPSAYIIHTCIQLIYVCMYQYMYCSHCITYSLVLTETYLRGRGEINKFLYKYLYVVDIRCYVHTVCVYFLFLRIFGSAPDLEMDLGSMDPGSERESSSGLNRPTVNLYIPRRRVTSFFAQLK